MPCHATIILLSLQTLGTQMLTLANTWNICGLCLCGLASVLTWRGREGGREGEGGGGREGEQCVEEGNPGEHVVFVHGNPVRGSWPRAETVTQHRTHPHTSSTAPLIIIYPRPDQPAPATSPPLRHRVVEFVLRICPDTAKLNHRRAQKGSKLIRISVVRSRNRPASFFCGFFVVVRLAGGL